MSPEQLAARPSGLDGRSDLYTLGVILFELLAHRLPYHLDQLPVHEVARVIDQQEPSRLGSIDTFFRGDVEIIVAKALEKDRMRRYASAGTWLRTSGATCAEKRSWPGPRRRSISYANLPGETKGWWPAFPAFSWRSSREPSFPFSLPCTPIRTLAWRANGSVSPLTRATAPGSRPRLLRFRVTTLTMPPGISRRRRGFSRLGMVAPAHPARRKHCRVPRHAGEHQFLVREPDGIRIARLKPDGLNLADVEGNELWTHSFPPVNDLMIYPPLFTRHGLRLFAKIRGTGQNAKYHQI